MCHSLPSSPQCLPVLVTSNSRLLSGFQGPCPVTLLEFSGLIFHTHTHPNCFILTTFLQPNTSAAHSALAPRHAHSYLHSLLSPVLVPGTPSLILPTQPSSLHNLQGQALPHQLEEALLTIPANTGVFWGHLYNLLGSVSWGQANFSSSNCFLGVFLFLKRRSHVSYFLSSFPRA